MRKKRDYRAYAVVTEDFKRKVVGSFDLSTCKKYLTKGLVVVRTYPVFKSYTFCIAFWKKPRRFAVHAFYDAILIRFLWFVVTLKRDFNELIFDKKESEIVCRYEDLMKEE